jgi:hypothetical protein
MTPEAATWHLHGERGISSEAIFDRLTYGQTGGHWGSNHPHDPSDFRRCELLLRAVPEFHERLSEMAAESPTWAALVTRWDEIAAVFEEECPDHLDAPKGRMADRTYELMRVVIDKAEGRS